MKDVRYLTMNKEEYLYIQTLKENDPKTYDFINNLLKQLRDEVSFTSHEIKNQLSFLRSSYQLISLKHPETNKFSFWPQLGASVETLINLMERTSIYRYSSTAAFSDTNIIQLLYSLPDIMDERFPNETRFFSFDTDIRDIIVDADCERLSIAFSEILANAYEASQNNDTIYISSNIDEQLQHITIKFINPGTIGIPDEASPLIDRYAPLTRQLCTPFYTDKKSHTGLGLAIVNCICCTHNTDFNINCDDHNTTAEITFPIKYIC